MTTTILTGCCFSRLASLASRTVDTCVTSPPYWGQRDYGQPEQLGLEPTPDDYVANMVKVFREVRRVLKDEGTLWLNVGDTYATGTTAPRQQSSNPGVGSNRPEAQNSVRRVGTPSGCKTKDLIGIPWMLAFALRQDGWFLRQEIIWHKPNAQPESVTDRCTKAHEHLFLLSKCERYYFDHQKMREATADGRGLRNRRSVWTIATQPLKEAHFATFPPALVEPCILAGSPDGGVVLDPFFGAGTTGLVAERHGRDCIGIELNSEYVGIAQRRLGYVECMVTSQIAPAVRTVFADEPQLSLGV